MVFGELSRFQGGGRVLPFCRDTQRDAGFARDTNNFPFGLVSDHLAVFPALVTASNVDAFPQQLDCKLTVKLFHHALGDIAERRGIIVVDRDFDMRHGFIPGGRNCTRRSIARARGLDYIAKGKGGAYGTD